MATKQLDLEPIAGQLPVRQHAPDLMSLIDYAVKNQSAIEVIKELRAMQAADIAHRAEMDFNDAMEAAQNEISEVIPDADNEQTGGRYATFKALNSAIRPVYLKHGFSLSFNGAPSPVPDEIYVLCKVKHSGGHSEPYMLPMSTDNKGPKGGGVMSKQQAVAAATSYGRSTLLKLIFNISVGATEAKFEELGKWEEELKQCQTIDGLEKAYKTAMDKAEDAGDKAAMFDLIRLKAKCRKKLEGK
jgi:hypothetical protein